MNKFLKWFLIIGGVFGLLFFAYKYLASKNTEGTLVAIDKVKKITIVESVSASGKIFPEVEVKISPDISGEITELPVNEGDSVHKGQMLARIYADIYALQRDEASSHVSQSTATVDNSRAVLTSFEANLKQAKQTYERNKKLYDDKVISKAELEQYETSLSSATANYNAAQQNIKSLQAGTRSAQTGLIRANKDLGRTTLIAPMNGIVSSLKVKKGERVAGNSFSLGTEMMTVSDMKVLEVRVDIGENDIVKINLGDSADITVDAYNNRKFKGIVTKIASSSKATIAGTSDVTNYEVRIRLDKNSYADLASNVIPFRPGMNASADIKTRRVENVISVPITAVGSRLKDSDKKADSKINSDKKENNLNVTEPSSNDVEAVVFILQKDNTVKKIAVKTGIQDMKYIEILSGLTEGSDVIVAPFNEVSKSLIDGAKVKVVEKERLFENKTN